MRVLILLIIFAIGFSGYMTAAHALPWEGCDPVAVTDVQGAQDVSHHAKASEDESGQNSASFEFLADCHDCCMSHVLHIDEYRFDTQQPVAVLTPMPREGYVGDFRSTLLRPPRSFV